jgi:tripartite-type tricarboxylate transporter receptor subunit TctC
MMKLLWAAACAAALLCAAAVQGVAPASAQSYPSKPVTIVVPFAAGGPADTLARQLGERMKTSLGQPIVVENVAGAAGATGVGRVVRAVPDGYTIGIGHLGTHVFNGALYRLPYDLAKDLEPIALLPSNYSVIVTKKDVPAKNLKDLVAWLKENPKQASAATAGIGSIAHVASVYFENQTGVALQIVPYRSGSAAFGDVLAGHVTLIFDQFTGSSVEMYRSGKVRPFAVTAKSRLASVPDLPTVDEAGLPGLYVSTWYGLWAPKGTPAAVIARLNAAVVEALAEPDLRKRLDAQSSVVPPREQQSPDALGKFQRAEIDKWWPTIKAANIKAE